MMRLSLAIRSNKVRLVITKIIHNFTELISRLGIVVFFRLVYNWYDMRIELSLLVNVLIYVANWYMLHTIFYRRSSNSTTR